MGNVCQPSCVKNNEGTVLNIKSSCFEKPLKIVIDDEDDDMLEHLQGIIETIHRKKTIIKDKRLSLSNSVKEPEYI